MSENDHQPQEPLNTRMSEDTGRVEIQSNARSDAIIEGQEWQMYNFGELLNLGELDRYMLLKMQHILSLNAAFKSVMPAFHQPYANTFQDIHIQSTARNSTFQTVGYCEEVYFSLSTPLEEIIQLVTLKSQEIQNSYGMTGFNFETNSGPIQWVPSHHTHPQTRKMQGRAP